MHRRCPLRVVQRLMGASAPLVRFLEAFTAFPRLSSRCAEAYACDATWTERLGWALSGAGNGCEIPNFKDSYLGRFPLISADFWTSDHLSERSRHVDAFSGTRARGTLTLKRR